MSFTHYAIIHIYSVSILSRFFQKKKKKRERERERKWFLSPGRKQTVRNNEVSIFIIEAGVRKSGV